MDEHHWTFGAWLKIQLRSQRITQTEFAARIGRSQGAVSRWISNREIPSPSSIEEIAKAFNVSPEEVHETIRRSESHPANVHKPLADLLTELEDRLPIEVRVQAGEPTTRFDPDFVGVVFLPYDPVDRNSTRNDAQRFRAFVTSERYMSPIIQPGDLVIVDDGAFPRAGDIILVNADVFIEPDKVRIDEQTGKRWITRATQKRDVDRELVRLLEIEDTGKDLHTEWVHMKMESVADGEMFSGTYQDDYVGKVVTTIRDFNHGPGEEKEWFRSAVEETTAKRQEMRRRALALAARGDRH